MPDLDLRQHLDQRLRARGNFHLHHNQIRAHLGQALLESCSIGWHAR